MITLLYMVHTIYIYHDLMTIIYSNRAVTLTTSGNDEVLSKSSTESLPTEVLMTNYNQWNK